MTPVILSLDNPNHFFHLQQWDEAVDIHNALIDWREANPKPARDLSSPELADTFGAWWDKLHAEEQRLGLNTNIGTDDHDKGRIITNRRFGASVLRLRRLTRDIDDKPTIGDRVVQCPHCGSLFSTFSQHDHFCTDACKQAEQASRTAAKVERRKQRQSERSAALASRTGICLACGNQFTLKRITAKTCSAACKKRLQRKPELAAEQLVPLEIASNYSDAVASERKHAQAALNLRMASIGGELTDEQQQTLDKCEAYLDDLRPQIQEQQRRLVLNAIAEHAPALGAWLMAQTEEVQRAACLDWEGIQKVLGPALRKKLQETVREDL